MLARGAGARTEANELGYHGSGTVHSIALKRDDEAPPRAYLVTHREWHGSAASWLPLGNRSFHTSGGFDPHEVTHRFTRQRTRKEVYGNSSLSVSSFWKSRAAGTDEERSKPVSMRVMTLDLESIRRQLDLERRTLAHEVCILETRPFVSRLRCADRPQHMIPFSSLSRRYRRCGYTGRGCPLSGAHDRSRMESLPAR